MMTSAHSSATARRPRASMMLLATIIVLITAGTALVAAQASPPRRATAAAGPTITWRKVTSGLTQPLQMLAAPDRTKRLFIVEKTGLVSVWSGGRLLARPYLDLTGRVSTDGERGLLSIAFDPSFRRNHFVYADYTRANGDIVVARFKAARTNAASVSVSAGRTVLRINHRSASNHNGGQLMFGRNGLLYISVGDGGSEGDPSNAAQSRRSLLGKILRIDVSRRCGQRLYCVPRTNPFAGSTPGRGEIWVLGLRNPWRFSFDSATGGLWVGDVGQDAWEEVDVLSPRAGGSNLGWSCWEARTKYNSSRCKPGTTYKFPAIAIPHPQSETLTGGFVYRGNRFPAANGFYIFGDYQNGRIWAYRHGAGRVLQAQRLKSVAGFGVDRSKNLYAVTLDGSLWRMRAS